MLVVVIRKISRHPLEKRWGLGGRAVTRRAKGFTGSGAARFSSGCENDREAVTPAVDEEPWAREAEACEPLDESDEDLARITLAGKPRGSEKECLVLNREDLRIRANIESDRGHLSQQKAEDGVTS